MGRLVRFVNTAVLVAMLPLQIARAEGGTVTGLTTSESVVQPNQPYTRVIHGTLPPGQGCTVINYINGAEIGRNSVLSFPVTNVHWFNVPGVYTVVVKGDEKESDPKFRCSGQAQATITVRASLSAQTLRHALNTLPPRCPPGTRVKSHNNATGAFSCVIDKANKPTCPPGTQYYETDCEFGCREIPR